MASFFSLNNSYISLFQNIFRKEGISQDKFLKSDLTVKVIHIHYRKFVQLYKKLKLFIILYQGITTINILGDLFLVCPIYRF